MHTQTKNRISFLQEYLKKNAGRWYRKYGENLSGIRIDKKLRGKNKLPYYTIVFQVVKKMGEEDISEKELIPPHFMIKFPDGKERKIKTDVQQTGRFEFHAHLLDPITDIASGETGTLGLFLQDNHQNVYALTNYHVAAQSLLYQNIFSYDVNQHHSPHRVRVNGHNAYLYKGTMTTTRDVAFVRLPSGVAVHNRLPGGLRISQEPVDTILGPEWRHRKLKFYLRSTEGSFTRTIVDNSTSVSTAYVRFEDLISVDLCTLNGDSGSPVLFDSNRVIGIVIGGDDRFTYILPYHQVKSFLSLSIL